MIMWKWSDTDCKNKWAIFARLISLTGPFILCVKSNTIKFEDSAAYIKLNNEKWGAKAFEKNESNSNACQEAKISVANDIFEHFEDRFESWRVIFHVCTQTPWKILRNLFMVTVRL